MTSRIFIFSMYFCPPSYFLTTEDISLKFSETIGNILLHVGVVHSSFYFVRKSCFKLIFHVHLTAIEKDDRSVVYN